MSPFLFLRGLNRGNIFQKKVVKQTGMSYRKTMGVWVKKKRALDGPVHVPVNLVILFQSYKLYLNFPKKNKKNKIKMEKYRHC